MNPESQTRPSLSSSLLERVTAVILVLVIAAVGGMVLAASIPGWEGLAVSPGYVVGAVLLLSAALVLVSIVALLHTR